MFKTNVMRILDKEKIKYNVYEYECKDGAIDGISVAKKMNQNPNYVFKTLVTHSLKNEIYIFVIPVLKELDLKKAAKSVNEKSIEMIHVKEINKYTGYIRGGCSPIGMKKQYKTVVDYSAQNLNTIIISAGKIGFQVEISPFDFKKIINFNYSEITMT